MRDLKDVEIYVDEDSYVCFDDDISGCQVSWTLHRCGWEAFTADSCVYRTYEVTLPLHDDRVEAARAVADMRCGKRPHFEPGMIPISVEIMTCGTSCRRLPGGTRSIRCGSCTSRS